MSAYRRRALLSIPLALGIFAIAGVGAAIAGFSKDTATKPVPYNVSQDANALCPHKQHVSFGGFKIDTTVPLGGSNGYTWLESMGPINNNTTKWSVSAENSGVSKTGHVTSYAYCRKGKAPKVVRASAIVLPSAANDEFRDVSVTCPKGKRVIGGGWAAKTPTLATQHNLNIMGLERTSQSTWQVSVVNVTGVQQSVTAVALCGKQKAPKSVTATVHIPPDNASKNVVADCPKGKDAMFGGFRGDYDDLSGRNAFVTSFSLQGDDAIKVHGMQAGVFGNDESATLKAFAYCA